LTYIVHAASTELAGTHDAVASEYPRRNRCFHSSIDKVVRPLHERLTASGSLMARPGRHQAVRSTRFDVSSRRQRGPLTDGRHKRRAQRSEDRSMWACHNDREEDQLRSPRESRVTVALRFQVVKETPAPQRTRHAFQFGRTD